MLTLKQKKWIQQKNGGNEEEPDSASDEEKINKLIQSTLEYLGRVVGSTFGW